MNIKTNSKYIKKGDIFLCTHDGGSNKNLFIKDACKRGAKCIITDEDVLEKIDIPIVKVDNIHDTLYQIYNNYYGKPMDEVNLIGITGTDGKTTTAIMIRQLFNHFSKTAYLGTNGFMIEDEKISIRNTTPTIDEVLKIANICREKHTNYLVMEASSEGLLHHRCQNLLFKRAILTNVTGDHLNVHQSFENYVASKFKLFEQIKKDGYAILNIDDKYYSYFKKTKAKKITYGTKKGATFRFSNIKETDTCTHFDLQYKHKTYAIDSPYIGIFNVYNLVASIATIHSLGIAIEKIIPYIREMEPIAGRNKFLSFGQDYQIILDYAHTLNATKEILNYANRIKKGNIITVVGCAGGRESLKRKSIGKIITDLSTSVIFTMDDPRYEKVEDIIREMIQEVEKDNYTIIKSRKKAIRTALKMAKKDDIVLILGKGEDNYMAVGGKYKKYSDLKEVSNYFKY